MRRISQVLCCLLACACFQATRAQAQDFTFPNPFQHVVVIFQENRTPDNLFQFMQHNTNQAPVQHPADGLA